MDLLHVRLKISCVFTIAIVTGPVINVHLFTYLYKEDEDGFERFYVDYHTVKNY